MRKILIIGHGGREHALAYKLSQSKNNVQIFVISGNAGTAKIATNIDIPENDNVKIVNFCIKENIDLVFIGCETPLIAGLTDDLCAAGVRVFAPTKAAANIEASKHFAKQVMQSANVPTAKYKAFNNLSDAKSYVNKCGAPIVVKYDGLAQGKGVTVAQTLLQANVALEKIFTESSAKVVIEEFLEGKEFSLICLVGSKGQIVPLPVAQDYKRAYDNDEGENTGGMGCYSPVDFIGKETVKWCINNIITPTLQEMKSRGCKFVGVLYAGLILTSEGVKVIEFNARFGDPECEVILPQIENNLDDIFFDLLNGNDVKLMTNGMYNVGIVLASKGYPAAYTTGVPINIEPAIDNNLIHMGTQLLSDGKLVTNGGRVLFALAEGKTLKQARQSAYKIAQQIKCDNLYYRTDIAKD